MGRHATRSLGLLQFPNTMINAVLVFNNNGQPRLTKFYSQLDTATQQSLLSQIFTFVSARPASACNFLPLPPLLAPSGSTTSPDAPAQITYRHYATLYFILISTSTESPLALLDFIQVFVEALDKIVEGVKINEGTKGKRRAINSRDSGSSLGRGSGFAGLGWPTTGPGSWR